MIPSLFKSFYKKIFKNIFTILLFVFLLLFLLLIHYYYYYCIINTLFTLNQVSTFFYCKCNEIYHFFCTCSYHYYNFFSLQPQQSFFLITSVTETISSLFVLILVFFLPLLNDIAACLRFIFSSLVGSTSLTENVIRSSSLYLFTRIPV